MYTVRKRRGVVHVVDSTRLTPSGLVMARPYCGVGLAIWAEVVHLWGIADATDDAVVPRVTCARCLAMLGRRMDVIRAAMPHGFGGGDD